MNDLKVKTLTKDNIVLTNDGYFRYVNHSDKLVTTGFKGKDVLLNWTDAIRFDKNAIIKMQKRYAKFYNK